MAFTVNGDHQRQCQVWEALKNGYNREPYHIRRLLTEGAVRAGDKRARFVGVEAYEAAGGVILRDLFSDADDGWLQDAALLNRLVAEKLESCAAETRGEGWNWVEAAVDFPYGHTFGLRRLAGEQPALTEEEQATYDALKAEYDMLQEGHDGVDELPDEIDQRLGELEAGIEAFEQRPWRFPTEEVVRAGAFVSLDPSGALRIERGFVKPEDEAPTEEVGASDDDADHADDDGSQGAASPCPDEDSDDASEEPDRPLPDRLLIELTEWRTLALRDALAQRPDIAHIAALHALCLDLFYSRGQHSCVDIAARQSVLRSGAAGLSDSAAAASIDARHQGFADALPADPSTLWEHPTAMEEGAHLALFALCVALSIDAVFRPYDRRLGAVTHANQLASAVSLDLCAAGWRPTADAYFERITKAQILDAVREAKGEEAVDRIASLKKPEMAKAAEELFQDSEWLPAVLRTSKPAALESLTVEDTSMVAGDSPDNAAIAAE